MKTIQEIDYEIGKALHQADETEKETQLNRVRKRVQFLNTCKMYLLTRPDEAFIIKEIERLEKRIKLLDEGFIHFRPPLGHTGNPRLLYEKETGIPALKTQLDTLKFIHHV
jgi:hypothetical protein